MRVLKSHELKGQGETFNCGFAAGCNLCLACVICVACDNCDACNTPCETLNTSANFGQGPGPCNTQQSFCTGSHQQGQLASTYIGAGPGVAVAAGDVIIKRTPMGLFQEYANWVAQAAAYNGDVFQQQDSGAWTANTFTPNFLKASELNELIAGINSLQGTQFAQSAAVDQVILASFMHDLGQAINNLQIRATACDYCNAGCDTCNACDTACNVCDSCNNCQTCVTCVGQNNSWSGDWSGAWSGVGP